MSGKDMIGREGIQEISKEKAEGEGIERRVGRRSCEANWSTRYTGGQHRADVPTPSTLAISSQLANPSADSICRLRGL